jgi:serine/threonine-protein kinase
MLRRLGELRKEERLFLEIGKRRGAIDDTKIARVRERAAKEGLSVIEVLISQKLVTVDEADVIRRTLFDLSFTCPSCENIDFRELDSERKKDRLCSECLAKETGSKDTVGGKTTHEPERDPRPRAPQASPAEPPKVEEKVEAAAPGASAPAEEIEAGAILGGCRIEKRIGQGGMGRVYKAHHDGLDRDMAVKVINERLAAKKGFVEQFFAEARTLAKLDHPNIVRVFNVDSDASSRHFIVMELLEGGSVESRWREKGKKLELDDAVRIAKDAAQGLLHAHGSGLIHRDVKPGNLMLTKEGRVKVVDFGLAARTENEVFIATEITGTPAYMAPEQIDGLRLDARCDQYALGASLFQLLCGRAPFTAKRPFEVLIKHVNEPPPKPSELREELPGWLDAVVLRMLAKRPADRFPSLDEVVKALEQKSAASPVAVAPARPRIDTTEILQLEKGLKARPVPPPTWRRAGTAMAACLVAAVLFILVPARDAFGGADLSLGSVPGYVRKLEKEARAKVKSGSPEDYASALTTLDEAVKDLGSLAGAATLKELEDSLEKESKHLASSTESELSKRVQELTQMKRWGALLDLADPESSTLAALGLKEKAAAWRQPALKGLAEQGEVYVAEGAYLAGEGAAPTLLKGFYLDTTEVTNQAWEELLEKASLERPSSWPAGALPAALKQKPVTGVSFEQAKKFAAARRKRLPTSAEWEKAARGTKDARAWPWGDHFESGRANLFEGGSGALEDVSARPKDASPFGALGMAGNVMEWVQGPEGPLVAGGAFRSHARSARVFSRTKLEGKDPSLGFRCARDLE